MTRELELSINSGRIYAGMSKIANAKQELKNKVQEIYNNPKLSEKGKKEDELFWHNRCDEICRNANEDMQEAVTELQNAVNTSQFTPSQEMRDTIDFIETMKAGGCLSDRVLNEQLSKFRGQEMNLIYLREKLKNSIGTDVFDKYTFSGYSKGDVGTPSQFISPDVYFEQLRKSLRNEDNTTTSYMMNGLEERLGIESAEGKKYKAERQAGIIGTSQLI
jgi:hypothetical protein